MLYNLSVCTELMTVGTELIEPFNHSILNDVKSRFVCEGVLQSRQGDQWPRCSAHGGADYNTKKSFNNCRLSFVIIGKVGINGAHGGH